MTSESATVNEDSVKVRPMQREDRRVLLEMMGRAFMDDPLAVYVFPEEDRRAVGFGDMCGLTLDHFGKGGIFLTNDRLQGLSIWQRPERTPLGRWGSIVLLINTYRVMRRELPRAMELEKIVFKHRPEEPHYYLSTVGTDPVHQGQGVGSSLIRPVTTRCDEERMPAYLESSKARNLPLYQKHGFEVREEDKLPSGDPFWTMWREPQ